MKPITNKLLKFFYILKSKKGDRLNLENVLNKELVTISRTGKKERKYYLLNEEGKIMSHNQESLFVKKYKVELYFLEQMGQANYDKLHDCFTEQIYLYLDLDPKVLCNEIDNDEVKTAYLSALAAYNLKLQRKKEKNYLSFYYCSKDVYAVDVLSSICKSYKVTKENNKYTLHDLDPMNLEQIKKDLVTILEDKKLKSDNTLSYRIL